MKLREAMALHEFRFSSRPRRRALEELDALELITAHRIIREIKSYMDARGAPYSGWYVGISANPWERLLLGHGLRIDNPCRFWDCGSDRIARLVERQILNELGTDGGTGGGDSEPAFVYAYLKGPHTNP